MPHLTVTQLFVHPVKSMRGVAQQAAHIGPPGFEGDRRWLVTDAEGRFITARALASLLLWQPHHTAHGLTLTSPDGHTLTVHPQNYTQPRQVTVWRDTFEAYGGPAEVDDWLSTHLGQPAHLVYLGEHAQRLHAPSDSVVSFADSAPFLLCSEASLATLNAHLAQPVAMRRFRPNIVIDGLAAYAEDGWTQLTIGGVPFTAYKPCTRCVMITLDPDTAAASEQREPLKTLASTHRLPAGACFGISLYAHRDGIIRVGDAVTWS